MSTGPVVRGTVSELAADRAARRSCRRGCRFSGRWPCVGLPAKFDPRLERVLAAPGVSHLGDHDPHRLPPGGALGVVGGGRSQSTSPFADLHAPVRASGGHGDVPGDGPGGLEVLGLRPEQMDPAAAAPRCVALQHLRGPAVALARAVRRAQPARRCGAAKVGVRPPGWRWPAVATRTPSRSATQAFGCGSGAGRRSGRRSDRCTSPFLPEPFSTLNTG